MYLVSMGKDKAEADTDDDVQGNVKTLLDDLIAAHKRGVTVKVILDQNIAYERKGELGMSEPYNKNKKAFEYLKSNGVDVSYDDMRTYTHTKGIVIDEEIVIIGSTNWSQSAFERNHELDVLIDSKELAQDIIKECDAIDVDEETSSKEVESYLTLNESVLINGLSTCVEHRSMSAWSIYFYLVQKYEANKEIALDYNELIPLVYLREGTTLPDASKRYYVRDALKSLAQNKMLSYINPKNAVEKPKIILSSFNDPKKPTFKTPKTFFTYGWDKRLSLAAQYCYCVSLVKGGEDMKVWSASIETTLSKTYKISVKSYTRGFAELRHWNLIKIQYAEMKNGKNAGPSTYRLMPVYSIETYEKRKAKLIEKYGKEQFDKAQKYAEIIFCENDLYEIEEIIQMMQKYGEPAVKEAFDYVQGAAENSPHRGMGYITGILQRIEAGKERAK